MSVGRAWLHLSTLRHMILILLMGVWQRGWGLGARGGGGGGGGERMRAIEAQAK